MPSCILDLTPDDEILQALTLFSMNMFRNLWNLWYNIVAFPITEAPQFKTGQIATTVNGTVSVVIATAIWWLNKRYPMAPVGAEQELSEYAPSAGPDTKDLALDEEKAAQTLSRSCP